MAKRSNTLPEMPMEQIREIAERVADVKVIVRRRTLKGTWESLPTFQRLGRELVDLEDYMREQFGGGDFRVVLRDPSNDVADLCKPFMVSLAGPTKALNAPAPERTPTRLNHVPPVVGRPVSLPTYGQVAAERQQLDPSQFMSQTPDAIALLQVDELRKDLRAVRAEAAQQQKDLEARLETERERSRQLERESAERERAHERQMLEMRMEMLTQQQQRAPAIDYVGLLAAVAPILTAAMSGRTEKERATLESQQRQSELQMEQFKAMVASVAPSKKGDDSTVKMIEAIMPLAIPLVQSMLDSRDPSKMIEILGSMGENQMATLSMVSQFVSQMAGESDNPWMVFAQKALEGVQTVAEQMVELTPSRQQHQQHAQAAQASRPVASHGAPPEARTAIGPDSPPRAIADALFATPHLPDELRSRSWYNVFIALHDRSTPPAAAASQLCAHLEKLADDGTFPTAVLGNLLETPGPVSVGLKPFLEQLPLRALYPDRMQAILREADTIMVDEDFDSSTTVVPEPPAEPHEPDPQPPVEAEGDAEPMPDLEGAAATAQTTG